jgi:hypothetical protein
LVDIAAPLATPYSSLVDVITLIVPPLTVLLAPFWSTLLLHLLYSLFLLGQLIAPLVVLDVATFIAIPCSSLVNATIPLATPCSSYYALLFFSRHYCSFLINVIVPL